MYDISKSGINPDEISDLMTRALAIDQELNYRLECADMFEELRILREQARCCFRTLAQVQNIIETSQYSRGRVRPIRFNLSEHLEDIASMIRSKLRSCEITLEFDIDRNVICLADPDRLSFCVVNLIVNSLQNVDKEEGRVKLSLKSSGEVAAVSVVDNGYGMSNNKLEELLAGSGGAKGFDILKLFCESVGTAPLFETTKNGGFSVTVKVPLAPPTEGLEFKASHARLNLGTISPCILLLYKLDDTTVTL